jgi:ABC-2 type transport system ATP-binding protein
MVRPPIIFLDEPTTGLDPKGRLSMWELIAELAAGGATVLMTTQYLEEADRLADGIVVINHGAVIAEGTSAELKERVGGDRLEVRVSRGADPAAAAEVLARIAEAAPAILDGTVSIPIAGGGAVTEAVRRLDAAGIAIDDIATQRPTLDDVFLALTGQTAAEAEEERR